MKQNVTKMLCRLQNAELLSYFDNIIGYSDFRLQWRRTLSLVFDLTLNRPSSQGQVKVITILWSGDQIARTHKNTVMTKNLKI